MVAVIADITERKVNSGAVSSRRSEERFRLVANTAPVLIWMAGADKLCEYLNQPWLEFTAGPLRQTLGNGWTEVVQPDDGTYVPGYVYASVRAAGPFRNGVSDAAA